MMLFRFVFFLVVCTLTVSAAEMPWTKSASVRWTDVPLGESLSRFAAAQNIGILLDRRIDPAQTVNFQAEGQPLKEILNRFADMQKSGCCFTGSTVYVCPKETANLLPAVFAENRKTIQTLPVRQRAVFRRNVSLTVPFLGEPKKILQELADKNKLRWKNLDILPFDVWDEKHFINVPFDELLTVLLAGFAMTFQIEPDGQTLMLVPFADRKLEPIINGEEPPAPSAARSGKIPLSQRRFTLKIEDKPLNALLTMLSQHLGLTLELDKDSLAAKGIAADARVSFDVKNATVQELFRAALKPLKLEFRISGETLTVR
jgi:hypothetical protein